MPKYQIDMTVNFSGEVEAETEEQAVRYFIEKREVWFYESLESESIEEIGDNDA